jgi:hypothetical protein
MNIRVLLFATVFLGVEELWEWVPADLRDRDRFEVSFQAKSHPTHVSLKRLSDGSFVLLDVGPSSPQDARQPIVMNQNVGNPVTRPTSGHPIGRQCLIVSRPGGYSITAVNDYERVVAKLSSPRADPGKRRGQRPDDYTPDAAWLERIARKCLVNYSRRRVGPVQSTNVAGFSVDSYLASGSGPVCGPFQVGDCERLDSPS